MTRLLPSLAIAAFASLTSGVSFAAYAQAPAPSSCGVETWSTDKMTYVGTPCSAGTTDENPAGASK